ncbi:vanadium-dependent haloperoxidase [Variovorax saccharolyticus]|uniref:vanadium-dependent haloperoxidase n=1 Tax=Variovorax saccharolyticus TaxID=3053516 RepID=UPI002575959B|nr:vanadium-dependent haloperoxidase [Variovorax sp. J22R187]MDM0019004.1 vanadium-dependent haloperoxidase [Variovorax sp. J22R187]
MDATKTVPCLLALSLMTLASARADVVTDWNQKASEITVAHQAGPWGQAPMVLIQAAVFEAVNAITRRYPQAGYLKLEAPAGASIDAAVAAANRAVLTRMATTQGAATEAAYQVALATVPEGPAKADGIALGEKAAAGILALRAPTGASPVFYRPVTAPGSYVPTVVPANADLPPARCWVLDRVDQFRPGPPPDLKSAVWARDFNEVKTLGARTGSQRTAEQTEIARFWTATTPTIYFPIARSVANQPGREVTQNARLLAASGQAMVDAIDAVFDAKYQYHFWRPFTAIRNGDQDGNDATERDAGWLPFIETPMHPEYPCAHCTIAASLGAVLKAEIGSGPTPRLSSTSPTLPGVTRSWASVDAFTQEVVNARIYDGVHYRNSGEVGNALGTKVGEVAAAKLLR